MMIHGDHASVTRPAVSGLSSVSAIAETVVDGQRVTMCHYPMRTWPGARRGAIHLFGHIIYVQ